MQDLIIGFSKPKKRNIISYLIMLFEKVNFSHTYIRFYSNKYNESLIYQANFFGVGFCNYNNFINKNQIVKEFIIKINEEEKSALIKLCIQKCGESYGYGQLIGMAINKILKSHKKIFIKGEVCSEIVYKLLLSIGKIKEGEDPDMISPKKVKELLEIT